MRWMRLGLPLCLLLRALAATADAGKPELGLADSRREFAPDQTIPLRLRNNSSQALFLIAERLSTLRTERGLQFPGVPVHERRKRKFFFRSDRWVYTSGVPARFVATLLSPGDAVSFETRLSQPASYRIYLRYWWLEKAEAQEFLRVDMKKLEAKYGPRARWLRTPSFRIKSPAKPKSP